MVTVGAGMVPFPRIFRPSEIFQTSNKLSPNQGKLSLAQDVLFFSPFCGLCDRLMSVSGAPNHDYVAKFPNSCVAESLLTSNDARNQFPAPNSNSMATGTQKQADLLPSTRSAVP